MLVQARGLGLRDKQGVVRLRNFSLDLHAGEIVGVAGVSGNGQSEVLELLSGLHAADSGTLQIGERTFAPPRWLDPRTARTLGIGDLP